VGRAGLAGLPLGARIVSISFRADHSPGSGQDAKTVEVELFLSNTWYQWIVDGSFSRHRGLAHSVFFSRRSVALPSFETGPAGPIGASVAFPLDRPFTYGGNSLCIEIASYGVTTGPWDIDAALVPGSGFGTSRTFGASCPAGNYGLASTQVAWPFGVPLWKLALEQPVTGWGAALLAVGVSGSSWNGMPLPLDLDPLLGTAGCRLYVDPLLLIPHSIIAARGSVVMPMLPNEPGLQGVRLFLQELVPDGSLPGGLGVSHAVEATIGRFPLGGTMFAPGDPGAVIALTTWAETPVVVLGH
jgi:hypothetical protein